MSRLPATRCRRCDQLDDVCDTAEIGAVVIAVAAAVFCAGTILASIAMGLWALLSGGSLHSEWLPMVPWAAWAGLTASCYWLGSATRPRC